MRNHAYWIFFVCVVVLTAAAGCKNKTESNKDQAVVVYTSVDKEFAQPITERFEKETGIKVKLVTDTEETKFTTGNETSCSATPPVRP